MSKIVRAIGIYCAGSTRKVDFLRRAKTRDHVSQLFSLGWSPSSLSFVFKTNSVAVVRIQNRVAFFDHTDRFCKQSAVFAANQPES
jgi:hypothetical protein